MQNDIKVAPAQASENITGSEGTALIVLTSGKKKWNWVIGLTVLPPWFYLP